MFIMINTFITETFIMINEHDQNMFINDNNDFKNERIWIVCLNVMMLIFQLFRWIISATTCNG